MNVFEVGGHRKRIVVIGDVMIDRWIHGHLAPSQDGCHKFVQERVHETLGGAGNAAHCLRNWSVSVELCGHVNTGRGKKTRFVDQHGNIVFRHDHDIIAGTSTGENGARQSALELVKHADGVLLSDYDKGFLTPELIRQISDLCRRQEIPCVADVKRSAEVYEECWTKANFEWSLRHGAASVVTNGDQPPSVNGSVLKLQLKPVKCINHVGAGDCFAAHLVFSLAHGQSLENAAAFAHSAGRVYVQFPHNRPPHPAEIAADMVTPSKKSTKFS